MQSHHPEHPALAQLFTAGYERFALDLLAERKMSGLPPVSCQAALRAEATTREPVQQFLAAARERFQGVGSEIYGPFPAQMERRGGRIRWYLLIQDRSRSRLQRALDPWLEQVRRLPGGRRVRWALDVDPQEF